MKEYIYDSDYKIELMGIGTRMSSAGLPKPFIVAAVETAFEFEGVCDLMRMWDSEDDESEKAEIIADIQDLIEDCQQQDKIEESYVRFDDLESIAKDIRTFKDSLRLVVDEHGGLNHLSEMTKIPQPSLSRFFNTTAMPRRNTLLKIAKALQLSQVEIATKWSK